MRKIISAPLEMKTDTRKNYRKRKLILFSVLVLILLLTAIFCEKICPFNPYYQDYNIALQPPDLTHPFGTDRFGRDMLSRVIAGSRLSIFSALILVAVIMVSGTFIGIVCGYCKHAIDAVIMRISEICQAFPGLVLALAISAVLNGGLQNAVLALAVVSWPKYARIARSSTLTVKNQDYISAARLSGDTPLQIMIRHILPNIGSQILVTAMLDISTMMLEISALSFLGLGAVPPAAEWGSMMSDGRSMLQLYPWVVLTPGLGIFISVTVFHLFGDSLRDYLIPGNRK